MPEEEILKWITGQQGKISSDLWHELALLSIPSLWELIDFLSVQDCLKEMNHSALMEKLYIHLIKKGIVKCNF